MSGVFRDLVRRLWLWARVGVMDLEKGFGLVPWRQVFLMTGAGVRGWLPEVGTVGTRSR